MSADFDPGAFLESAPLVPLEIAVDSGELRYIGDQVRELLGVGPSECLEPGRWTARVVPDDVGTLETVRDQVGRDGNRRNVDYRMERADGRIVWVCESINRADAPDGPVLRGYLIDITDRKRREVARWKNEERLRGVFRSAPDALVLTDMDGRIVRMNDQAQDLLSYRLEDVIGSSFDHLVSPRFQGRLPELRDAFQRDPDRRTLVYGHDFAIQRSDGHEVPVELGMGVVVDGDESRQLLCSLRDLTVRRRVEAQLRSSERHLREMADVLPAMVCIVDREHRYRFANDAFAAWNGWDRHAVEGRRVAEVMGGRLYAAMRDSIEAALTGTAGHFRGEIADREGRTVPVDISLVPQQEDDGRVSGCFVVIFDVTIEVAAREADRRHRDELAHVGRVATLGELAASIAHELNQPLSAIVANAQAARRLMKAVPPDLDEVADALDDITAAGIRAGDVISSMRGLLQRGETRDEAVDLPRLVEEAVELLHSEAISRGVTVVAEAPDAASVRVGGDPIQLKQVLLNIVMNAIEAASRAPSGSRRVTATVRVEAHALEVRVRDTGPGLPTGDPEELFAPFVSRRSGGLGMGLAISRSIVEAHDGAVSAENAPDGGALVRVRLPLS